MPDLAIQSGDRPQVRGCDLVALHVRDVTHGGQVASRTTVVQKNDPAGSVRTDRADANDGGDMDREGVA